MMRLLCAAILIIYASLLPFADAQVDLCEDKQLNGNFIVIQKARSSVIKNRACVCLLQTSSPAEISVSTKLTPTSRSCDAKVVLNFIDKFDVRNCSTSYRELRGTAAYHVDGNQVVRVAYRWEGRVEMKTNRDFVTVIVTGRNFSVKCNEKIEEGGTQTSKAATTAILTTVPFVVSTALPKSDTVRPSTSITRRGPVTGTVSTPGSDVPQTAEFPTSTIIVIAVVVPVVLLITLIVILVLVLRSKRDKHERKKSSDSNTPSESEVSHAGLRSRVPWKSRYFTALTHGANNDKNGTSTMIENSANGDVYRTPRMAEETPLGFSQLTQIPVLPPLDLVNRELSTIEEDSRENSLYSEQSDFYNT